MLELKSIKFSYTRKGPLVLNDCGLKIDSLGLYLVIGSNGSGKSTLMDVMTGFKQPREGKVLVNGVDVYSSTKAHDEVNRLMSYMPSSLRFPDHLYVDSILDMYAGPYFSKTLSQDLGIDKFLDKKYSELSDGFKTRLALNVCLSKGAYVFLDEPLKSQDDELKSMFPDILKKYTVGRTVVICSPQKISGLEWDSLYELDKGGLKKC